MRRILALPAAAALLAIPALASAHAPLESSTPAAGAKLDTAPTSVTLTFTGANDGELNPDGSSFTVTDADGTTVGTGKVDLTVANRNVMKADVTITEPGVYTVKWTSESADGATLTGQFSFGYKTDVAIPAASGGEDEDGDHGTPDTAIGIASGSSPLDPLTLVGGVFLLSGGALVARRMIGTAVR
jgi:methionine-rich copper-binding protein CopC